MSTITSLAGSDAITTADSMTKINTNFTNLNTDKIETSVLDTDTALAANSDSKIATQKAVKAYADAIQGPTIKTSGVSAGPASSSTQTITHSLGFIPTVIRVTGYGKVAGVSTSSSPGSTTGTYTSSGNRCAYIPAAVGAGDSIPATSTTFAIYLSALATDSDEDHASGVIQNVTSTSFDIVWTLTGASISAISAFMWETN